MTKRTGWMECPLTASGTVLLTLLLAAVAVPVAAAAPVQELHTGAARRVVGVLLRVLYADRHPVVRLGTAVRGAVSVVWRCRSGDVKKPGEVCVRTAVRGAVSVAWRSRSGDVKKPGEVCVRTAVRCAVSVAWRSRSGDAKKPGEVCVRGSSGSVVVRVFSDGTAFNVPDFHGRYL